MVDLTAKDDLFEEAIFNTTVNLYVPMFAVSLPGQTSSGDSLDLTYQVAFALFGLLAAITYIGVPSSLAIAEAVVDDDDKVGRARFERSTATNISRILDDLGLNWEECLKFTICEAHRRSAEIGLLALPFQIFYPPPFDDDNDDALTLSRAPSPLTASEQTPNTFQMAAKVGARNGRQGGERNKCGVCYNCFFDTFALLKYFTNWSTRQSFLFQ